MKKLKKHEQPQVDPIFGMLPDSCRVAVEIGSNAGHFARRFLENVPDCFLWCVDPWDLSYERNLPPRVGVKKTAFHLWEKNVASWRGTRIDFIRKKSWDAVKDFHETIDFLFIDGDHRFEAVYRDLSNWVPKVRSGGLVCGHDWSGNRFEKEVQSAVRRWMINDAPKDVQLKNGHVIRSNITCFWFYVP